MVRSLARRILCWASDSAALRATVSSSAFLSPRRGTRRLTRLPRPRHSHSSTAAAAGGRTGTSTSRGMLPPAGRGPASGTGPAPALAPPAAFAGDGVLAVDLAEELLHQLAGGDVLDLVHHPAALAADPAAADVEHLHGRFELVLGQRDHVAVGAVAEHHGLPFQRPRQRLDVVPQPRGPLVLLGPRGLAHLRFEPLGEPGRLPGHEVAELLGEVAVLHLTDAAHARRRALADVAEQARPADLAGPLEHPRRAGADREHPQQRVHGLPDRPRVRVRPEVAGAAPFGPPGHHHPRELLVQRDGQVGVALVVPVPDVEPGAELLDPGVLQLQGLHLGADHGPVHARRGGQHRLGTRVQAGEVGEVGVQPGPQVLGLAHVDDPAMLVTEPVHAG